MKGKYIGDSDPLYCINGKTYSILGEDNDMYIVIDEIGYSYLYEKEDFVFGVNARGFVYGVAGSSTE